MDFAHIHLLLNHFPVIGMIIGVGLFLFSFIEKNEDLRRASLIIFAAIALITIPTFTSGVGAQPVMTGLPGISEEIIKRHESAAMLSLWFMEVTGALALVGLWQMHFRSRPTRWNVLAVLVFSLMTVVLMSRTSNTGGDIRHPEIRVAGDTIVEGPVGSFLHMFEPNPDRFTELMVGSKWWWAFLMDLHFVGLALLIGTVGLLDIRIMGFFKQLPVEPLHLLVPWALAGLGINILTGMLAFIGMPAYYSYDMAFWLKIVAILLLGVNAALFYLTDIFGRVERLQAGEDAPASAKLLAASSLFLWLAVVTLGRYIQVFQDSIPSPK
jgi:uncharacterized membrane protein